MEDIKARVANLVSRYPHPQLAVLPVLWYVAQEGEISEPVVEIIANCCEVEPEAIRVLLGSYPRLLRAPKPTTVCVGLSCVLNGAQGLYSSLCEKPDRFGLKVSGVEKSPCLGYCYAAPVVRDANGVLYSARSSQAHPDAEISTKGI